LIFIAFTGLFFAYIPTACASLHIPSKKEIQAMEVRILRLINTERSKHGLASLSVWNVLGYYAYKHSQDMADGREQFGHHGFEKRAEAIKKYRRHTALGENLAYCYLYEDPLQVAVDEWMHSNGHRKNILGDFQETGIGIVYSKEGYCYITQLFAKTRCSDSSD
jgi:uncharacterized protein YkwD